MRTVLCQKGAFDGSGDFDHATFAPEAQQSSGAEILVSKPPRLQMKHGECDDALGKQWRMSAGSFVLRLRFSCERRTAGESADLLEDRIRCSRIDLCVWRMPSDHQREMNADPPVGRLSNESADLSLSTTVRRTGMNGSTETSRRASYNDG